MSKLERFSAALIAVAMFATPAMADEIKKHKKTVVSPWSNLPALARCQ
jgi:ABC-type proline/glycine betaine transport system substrate-binding protein